MLLLLSAALVALTSAQAPCVPPSYTATILGAVDFAVYDYYSDAVRDVLLYENVDSDAWRLVDSPNQVYYTYNATDGCVKIPFAGDLAMTRDSIYRGSEFEYNMTLPGGYQISAWTYTHTTVTMRNMYDPSCVPLFTSISINGHVQVINIVETAETENPDLSQLDARYQQVQDPTFCK